MRQTLIKLFASGIYSGFAPIVPGTVGTVPAWLIAYFGVAGDQRILVVAAVVLTCLSVWIAGAAEAVLGHDSRKIVIDEWAGMFIALVLVPFSLTNYTVAFVAFRLFDVVKIFPAGQAERLPRGWGVTLDDVAAGIQANVVTQLFVFLLG